jgi:hypothetical protein
MFLDRIERLYASFTEGERQMPSFVAAQAAIARDTKASERFLRFAADADLPRTRARMIELAARSVGCRRASSAPSSSGCSET